MFAKTIIVLAVAAQAFAGVFITSPTATTSFSGGQQATVTWIDNGQSPALSAFGPAKISIYAGNALQQTSLQVITPSVNVATTAAVTFTVDPTIGPNSNEYFIRVESISLKDASSPQYPALAFSAKFALSGMTGTFTSSVQAQIAGQSTAPLTSPSSTPAAAAAAAASTQASVTAASASHTGSVATTATHSGSAAAASKTAAASGALSIKAGWAGVAIGALAGVALY